MHKKIMATALSIITFATLATPAQAHDRLDTSHKKYGGIMADKYYDILSHCETAGNWKHATRNHTGGLGIARGTAYRWSGHRGLAKFHPRKQVQIADRIAFTSWDKPNGERVWRVGPFGWGCVKRTPILQQYICQSHHKLVVKWKRGC